MTASTKALTIPSPSIGNLDHYIRYINQLPMLSEKEESELAHRLKNHNDVEAARQLVLSHLRLVVSVARNFMGYGLPLGDLIQEGNVGLMRAVRRFDPERKVRLVSYSLYWIRAHIFDFIQKNVRMVKSATTKSKRKLFFNLRAMKKNTGNLPHSEVVAISKKLKVSVQDVIEMSQLLSQHDTSLEAKEGDESWAPIDYLEAENDRPDQILETKNQEHMYHEGLQKALTLLDSRTRRIVEARWLSGEQATLHQLASELGISHERVRQIEVRAFKKIREYLSTTYH